VREVVCIALKESDYIVFEAATIAEAEAAMTHDGENFELLFSDVILPDGNGIDFAAQVIRRRPEIKVLLSSGYTEEKSRPDFIAEKKFHFLQKPYPLNQMLEIVHQILSE
jgi:DNA-binding NtrC family response regulator